MGRHVNKWILALTLGVGATSLGCEGAGVIIGVNGTVDTLVIMTTIDSVAIVTGGFPLVADRLVLDVGDEVTLAVSAFNALGQPVQPGNEITWETSDELIASVAEDGTVTGVGPGEALIGASLFQATGTGPNTGATAFIPVLVLDPDGGGGVGDVSFLSISPATTSLGAIGETVQLTASGTDAAGNPVVVGDLTWNSSVPSVATVDADGLVTATGFGSTSITVDADCCSRGYGTVIVSDPAAGTDLFFQSTWSTELGDSPAAHADGGRWNDVACSPGARQNAFEVVPGGGVGWTRTANVFRITQAGEANCGLVIANDVVPQSTSHYGRIYFRNDETTSTVHHALAYNGQGPAIQLTAWSRQPEGPNGFKVFIRTYYDTNGNESGFFFPGSLFITEMTLENGVWYRYEWFMEYVTPTTYRIWPRIYDMAGTLLADARTFVHPDAPGTLQQAYDAGHAYGFTDVRLGRNLALGQEGQPNSPNSGEHWYHGDIALSFTGWIGG